MRIGVDALSLKPGRTGGGETYIANLLVELDRIEHGHELVVYALPGLRERLALRSPAISWVEPGFLRPGPLAVPRRLLWEQAALPGEARRRRLDAFLFLGNVMSLRVGVPSVVTIHDVVSWWYVDARPGRLAFFRGGILRRLLAASARRATRVLASSAFTRDELVRRLGVPAERIVVNPLGIRPAPTPSPEARARAAALRPFLLHVGTQDVHKDLPTLLAAVERLGDLPHRLVLAGMRGNASAEIGPTIARLGPRVVELGPVDDDLLAALYEAADVFVFPSVYEGFGFPVLEAMRAGTPVIMADAGPLPELAVGDAALLVPPGDPDALAGALRRVVEDSTLRERLRTRGRERAAPDGQYSWRRTALQVLAEIHRLGGTS